MGERMKRMQNEQLIQLISKDITVVIPTKNEEKAIGKVIDELKGLGFNNILVVDGYSTDKTAEIVKSKQVHLIYQIGKGKTGALQTAIDNVNTSYIMVIDGDYTYDPSNINELLNYIDSHAEVIGFRIPISDKSMTKLHKFGNKVLTFVFNILMGTKISDICSGLYILRTDIAKQLRFTGSGFDVEVEIAAQIASKYSIAEAPINYRPRIGKEKLSTWRHGFSILASIIKFGLKYNPRRFYTLLSMPLIISLTLLIQVLMRV
jgi:dolichol-phosphate mannosyltransferase